MWKTDFISMLYPIKISDSNKYLQDKKNAYELKNKNMPEKLFKYSWIGESPNFSIDNFINNQVYLNKPSKFNDVFDCRSYIDLKKTYIENQKNFYKQNLENFKQELFEKNLTLRQFFRLSMKSKKKFKIFKKVSKSVYIKFLNKKYINFETLVQESVVISCFSENFNSNLMWGHYTNKHNGFVLEYNFKELGNQHILNQSIYPVIYQKNVFDLTAFFSNENLEQNCSHFLDLTALIKSDDWSYEKEWRLILKSNEGILCKVPSPKAIYLGINIDTEYKDWLIDIAKIKNMKIYQMVMKKDKYGLDYEEIK